MNLDKAMKKARKAIESTYEDSCNVFELLDIYDENSKQTTKKEVIVLENQSGKISYKTVSKNEETETGSEKSQVIEMFISPDIKIKSGSKIEVTHRGIKTVYKNSGEPSIYETQQTIILELFDKWS